MKGLVLLICAILVCTQTTVDVQIMAENLKLCHICYQKHVSTPSTVWCHECEQGFCSECVTFHSSIQSSKSHVTTPIEQYLALGESIQQIRIQCLDHDEKYQMFCQTHDAPLCHSCMKQHSKCKDVTPLKTLVKNIKHSENLNAIEESLKDIELNIAKIKTCLEKNKATLDKDKTVILSEVRKTRKLINDYLDTIENRLTRDITDLNKKTKHQLDSILQSLHDGETKALRNKKQVGILKTHGSDIQTFLAFRKISTDINSSRKDLQAMMTNKNFDQVSLECDINDKLTHLSSDIEQFGEVRLLKTPCNITLDNHTDRHAQDVVCSKSFDYLNTKLVKSFETKGNTIFGCDLTKDGHILLTDAEKCLICIDKEGKHLFTTCISIALFSAFDVTCIDDITVAVTSGGHKVISIIDISSRTVKKHINVGYFCYGVTHRDGTLLVCAEGRGILSINLTNKKMTTIVQCDDLPRFSYITTYKDKLYYTNHKSETVTCCDMEGNIMWTFKDAAVFSSPRGITTDNEGRVYVCEYLKDHVVVLSNDGRQSKTIITKADGLRSPYAIHFDKKRNNLLTTNKNNGKVFLFNVSS